MKKIDGRTPELDVDCTWEDLHSELIPDLQLVYKMAQEEGKKVGYAMVSVRSLVSKANLDHKLRYILQACVDGGFEYCLDHDVKCSSGVGDRAGREFPSSYVCYWGWDQLVSRLDCVHHKIGRL